MSDYTMISIDPDTADDLYRLKGRGDSYDHVIRQLMENAADPPKP